MLFDPSVVHSVLDHLLVLFLVLMVPPVVLVLDVVLHLVPLLCVHPLLVDGLHALGEMVGWRKSALIIFTMLYLQLLEFLLVLDLALLIVELAEHRVIIMSLPVLAECCLLLFLVLLPCSLLVVLVVDARHNVELFGIVLDQHFLSLHWQPHFSVVEVEIGQHRVVYHIISIPNGT